MKARKSKRSGGFLVACDGAGTILGVEEFFGGESLTQRAAFLASLKRDFPGIRTIVHDDACHLRKFLDRWLPTSPELRFPNLDFLSLTSSTQPATQMNGAKRTAALGPATVASRISIRVRARSSSLGCRSARALSGT